MSIVICLDTKPPAIYNPLMNIFEILFFSFALSADAFAVAVCIGITLPKFTLKNALIIGLYFGVFQALMPLAGYWLGAVFAERITAFDHIIAFVLLTILGSKTIYASFKPDEELDLNTKKNLLGPATMLPFAVATSIDALAAGVSFAFMRVSILPLVATIGVVTFLVSAVGVGLGRLVGARFKTAAERIGGSVLIVLGVLQLLG